MNGNGEVNGIHPEETPRFVSLKHTLRIDTPYTIKQGTVRPDLTLGWATDLA
jgi:hypothetical protein